MRLSKNVKKKLEMKPHEWLLKFLWQQGMITLGAVLWAVAYVVFQLPYKIAAGGVSGLALIVNHLTGFPPGLFVLLVNIPLFVLGFYALGRWKFVGSSIWAVLVFSGVTELFIYDMPLWLEKYPVTEDSLLAAIYAGVIFGLGTGLIYRAGGTGGGTGVIARILYNKTGFPLSQTFLASDMAIIVLAGVVFNLENALLALLTLVLTGVFSDFVLEGPSQMRTLMIITEKPDPIQQALMHDLQRGVSSWDVVGGWSGKTRTMLYLTVLRSRIADVKFIIANIDPDAFMVVGVSHQTWGGYNAPKISKR